MLVDCKELVHLLGGYKNTVRCSVRSAVQCRAVQTVKYSAVHYSTLRSWCSGNGIRVQTAVGCRPTDTHQPQPYLTSISLPAATQTGSRWPRGERDSLLWTGRETFPAVPKDRQMRRQAWAFIIGRMSVSGAENTQYLSSQRVAIMQRIASL